MATKKTKSTKGGTKKAFNVYQMITDKIVEQMEKGLIPWRRPWSGTQEGAISYTTRKPYSLINQMLLGKPGEYLTFKQVKALGGSIKKGAKSGIVCFYSRTVMKKEKEETEDGDTMTVTVFHEYYAPILKFYPVFHIDDCEGIESKLTVDAPTVTLQPVDMAERTIQGYLAAEPHLKFINNKPSNRAYFSPAADEVVVPMMSQYQDVEEYYSTAFHELTHSTLIESRCNRKSEQTGVAMFGNEAYSREELVAEMGAAMLVNVCGMDCDKAFKNSVAYIQGWLKQLKNDPKMIVWASSRAEKAARYIQGEREAKTEEGITAIAA